MKICIVSDAYYPYPSGVSEYGFYVAKYLRKFGHDVQILTTAYPNLKGIKNEETEKGVKRIGRVFFVPINKSFATPTIGWGIPRIVANFIKKENFDVLHLHTPLPPGISYYALRASKGTNIGIFHSTGFKFFKRGSGLFKSLFGKNLRKIHGRIAISPSARDSIASYVPGDFKIIPCGVDTEKFHLNVQKKKELQTSNPKILYFGRLDRRKGLPELLKAIPIIKKKIPNILLVVAGRGPLEKECKKLAKELKISGSVIFKGFIPDEEVPSYYASCDVYCSPALGGESFGIVLLEAMAVGTPVAASNIIGYDFVIKNEYNGLLFNPRDPKDIAGKVLRIITDKKIKDKLVDNGKNFVKNYSWEKVVKDMENFYLECAKKS